MTMKQARNEKQKKGKKVFQEKKLFCYFLNIKNTHLGSRLTWF